MKRTFKIMLVALLVLIIAVPSILVWSSLTQRFIFSSGLNVTDFVEISEDSCLANATDRGRYAAQIYVRIEHPLPNSNRIPILFSITPADDTELDSLSLRFSTEPYVPSLFLEASSYDWPEFEFHRNGREISFSIKDLGWYGESTTTLHFILEPDPHSDTLSLTLDFSMHHSIFMQLATLKGHSLLNAQLSNLN